MTTITYLLPMESPRRIVLLVYPGCQLLDATGPATVFSTANSVDRRRHYEPTLVSEDGGLVMTDAGLAIATSSTKAVRSIDTLLVAGGDEAAIKTVLKSGPIIDWLRRRRRTGRRIGSVCTGAFLLAAAGVLDGRRVATHWGACTALRRRHPDIRVDEQALFVNDGDIWTSAGVTTGLDMALAMVEADVSARVANDVARTLVLYARRPGHQTQFSPLLEAQDAAGATFAKLIRWMAENLTDRLDVPTLAARAGMTERSFYRRFTASTGASPARFIETLRLDAARALLDQGATVKSAAAKSGFGSAARMSLVFERRFGLRPTVLSKLHARQTRRA